MKPQPYRKEKVPGRNDRCPCGSGKKAKRCCLSAIEALAALPPHLRQQVVVAKILSHSILSPPLTTVEVEDGGAALSTITVTPPVGDTIVVTS